MKEQPSQSLPANAYLNLDPRTKLFLLLIISTIMISGEIRGMALYARLVLAAIPFVLLIFGRRAKAAAIYAILFAAAWLAEAFLIYNTKGIANIVIVMLSGLISRFVPCVIMGYYTISTTRVSEFLAAMERMRFPRNITIPIAVMFRFFPTIAEESHSIDNAMKMRGIGARSFVGNPAVALEYRLVPLLMSVVKIGDELSASALTRGLGGPEKRTNVCKIGFGAWDAAFASLAVSAAVFYFVSLGG
jgi:energy-coupling factor transporter transmembrane protein EcfT